MRRILHLVAGLLVFAAPAQAEVGKPAAAIVEGVPAVPAAVAEAVRPYMEYRTASFQSWNPRTRGMAVTTRFGNVDQVHEVSAPMGMRRQLSFEPDAIVGASHAREKGDMLIVQKDVGGNEFWQLYTLAGGRLTLLTDGKSRNAINAWSRDGEWLAYSSTRRNGTDSDLYIIDPRRPSSDRLLAQVAGGGWAVADFAPGNRSAVLRNFVSAAKTDLFQVDVASGRLTPIGDHKKQIFYGLPKFAPDGTLWVTSDEGGDFHQLGRLDVTSGRFSPVAAEARGDVESFDIAPDGSFVAYLVNEAGISRLKLLDVRTGKVRVASALPAGVAGQLMVAPWGDIGLTLSSARSAADAYSVDPQTLAVTRWTESETGGLDVRMNAEPELVTVNSFDGERVSGFLYRPDPRRFPGKRPLIMNIHGGPEDQSRPEFLGPYNYYINELGIALFYPNVRGSTGFGKRFGRLDDGPFKREDAVRDIGAFLDVLQRDPALDAARFGVFGASYGGYMALASIIRYAGRFKAGIEAVGISNFVSFLENTQDYRRDLRRVEYGDERDPAQRAKLLAISPLTQIKKVTVPLMVLTGGNDPRVPPSEADQVVRGVRGNSGQVWHVLFQDEGHGFAKKENQDYALWTMVMFWQQHLLGGKSEGPGKAAR
jgi:dipeptidyl aminopeptidase/acylaminoacyl peptidase